MPITRISGATAARGQTQFTRVPYGWDTGYREAQAALSASGTPIRVWMHGDSIMCGHLATNASSDAFRWLVRNYLVAKFGQSADYFAVGLSADASGIAWNGSTPPWTMALPAWYVGGTTKNSLTLAYSGMGGDATWSNPGAGTTFATFTHQAWLENCQAYDLVCPNTTAGTPMSYNVNAAGANNVTLTADGRIQVIQMATGLAAGKVNTIFKGVGASGQPWISGVTAHATTRGAAGVQVAHMGFSGAVLSTMDSTYLDRAVMGRDASTGTVGLGGFPMCPDLVICNFIMSETASYSPDISAQRLGAYVECLRRANQNCSIIFVASYRPNGITTDGAAFDNYSLSYQSPIEAMIMIAEQYGCAFVNVHAAWQGRAVTNGYTTGGEIHPTTTGHAAIAAMLTPLL